jgi:hypothetical protein
MDDGTDRDDADLFKAGLLGNKPSDGAEPFNVLANVTAAAELEADLGGMAAASVDAKRRETAERLLKRDERMFENLCRTVSEWGWADSEPKKQEWLLKYTPPGRKPEGVLPRGKLGLVSGEGGIGKSTLLLQLAVAVTLPSGSSSKTWLGWDVAPSGDAMILLGEEDPDDVHRRLARIMADLSAEERAEVARRLHVAPLHGEPGCVFVQEGESRGELEETPFLVDVQRRLSEGENWALVVVDPLSRFAGPGTETDNAAATRFIQWCERLTRAPGNPTALLAHHMSKAGRSSAETGAARGSSALTDGVRWACNLTRIRAGGEVHEWAIRLTVPKSNYTGRVPPRTLRSMPDGTFRAVDERDKKELADWEKTDGRGPRQVTNR